MAIIGIFTKQENGSYSGTMQAITFSIRASFEPVLKGSDKSPDFRVMSGLVELGAAWERTGKQGRYLSVSLDDPSFAAPIHCRLIKATIENGFSLVWDRPKLPKAS